MKLEERYSAAQVAGVAMVSAGIVWLLLTVSFLPWERWFGESRFSYWLAGLEIVWVLLGVAAAVIMYRALAAFARGVEREVWDKASLDRIKVHVELTRWNVSIWTLSLCAMGFLVFEFITQWHARHTFAGPMAYFWLSPVVALAQIRNALRPKPKTGESIWAGEVKPLVSEHWGSRETPAH